MCGIAGIISPNKNNISQEILSLALNTLQHRGPNAQQLYINKNNSAGLAHTRLSIIDTSQNANQPMHWLDKYSIVYNGEIYNYIELKEKLIQKGYHFKTKSDTEVILAAFDAYGKDCIAMFDGMFALAIINHIKNEVFFARDSFGQKPLYYCFANNSFYFASEIKVFWKWGIPKTINNNLAAQYIALGITQNSNQRHETFFNSINNFLPGHNATLQMSSLQFSIKPFTLLGKNTNANINETDAIEQLQQLLQDSIRLRLRSDVPIGTSLSGGLDSSSIAYFIKQQGYQNFKTFSAVFTDFENSEHKAINEIASFLKLENLTISPQEQTLVNDFEKLAALHDEPMASSSVFAQYKVYELAKQHGTTVILDGQGADEIFAGYYKYLHWYLQELVAKGKLALAKTEYNAFKKNGIAIPFGLKNIIAALFANAANNSIIQKANAAVYGFTFFNKDFLASDTKINVHKPLVKSLNDILHYNTTCFGLEELLRYADRNSMAHGVEVRLPFLSEKLVRFAFSLPSSFKIQNGFTKHILRKTMEHKLPNPILFNPKKIGFETPQQQWMQNKQMQDLVVAAKQKLVDNKILHAEVLKAPIVAQQVHAEHNYDWRYLSLATVL
jgi:asparagine synthase (glutamine-hydrolysing)